MELLTSIKVGKDRLSWNDKEYITLIECDGDIEKGAQSFIDEYYLPLEIVGKLFEEGGFKVICKFLVQ